MKKTLLVLLAAAKLWAQNPATAAFPTRVATDADLPPAVNRPATAWTLNGSISPGATSITLNSVTGINAKGKYSVDSEIFLCSALSGSTLTCAGAQEGTTAASHSSGATWYSYLTALDQNQGFAEIKAIEASLAARTLDYVAGAGTAQAQTATLAPPVTALAAGLRVRWLPVAANTAAAPTFAPNGLTAKPITKLGTTSLVANDITTAAIADAIYDGTEWQLQNPQTNSGGGGSMVYPGAGVPNSTGSAWGTSYAVGTSANDLVQLNGSAQLPALSAALLTNFPLVPLSGMSNLAADSFICNNLGSNAVPLACTQAQATALLNLFSSSLQGLVPASGGGTTNFLRADGTWAAPSGGGGGGNTYTSVSFSATPTFTRSSANQQWAITLTGNVTSSTLASASAGDFLVFNITQDATGGRTFAWPAGFSEACTIASTASVGTKQTFYWDGSAAHAITPCVTTTSTSDLMLTDAPNTLTSAGTIDASAASVTGGMKLPAASGAAPTADDVVAFNTAIHAHVWGSNGNTIVGAAAGLGTTVSTACTNQHVSAVSGIAAPICTGLTAAEIAGSATPGTGVTLSGASQIYFCTSTCTVTVPVPALNLQYCVFNDDSVSTVITLAALGSSARYESTARTGYGTAGTGTFVSGGAVKDFVCIVGRDSTHYETVSFNGTWTAN